jgi:uncharacterized protein involved in exopolysaccharide biosynthesis
MTTAQRFSFNAKGALATVWHYRLLVAAIFAILFVLSLIFVATLPRSYVAGANLLVVNGTTRDDPTLSSPDLPSIAASTVVLSRMETSLGMRVPLATVKRHLIVKEPAYRSSILRIEYVDASPEQAMLVANGVADQLTKYYREISTTRYDDDIRALDAELNKQRDRTRTLSTLVNEHGAQSIASGTGADALAAHFNDLETSAALAQAGLIGDTAQLSALTADGVRRQAMARYEVLRNDPTYVNLQTNVALNAANLATERASFTSKYPGLPALESKVKSLESSLGSEEKHALSSPNAYSPSLAAMAGDQRKAQAVVDADRAKVAALNGLLQTERTRTAAFPAIESARLERDAAQASYLAIATRRATAVANRADALSLGSVVIVDRAIVSDTQVGFSKSRWLLFLGFLTLALAVSGAFIADQLNPRLTRTSQVEDIYGRPVVATIGHK